MPPNPDVALPTASVVFRTGGNVELIGLVAVVKGGKIEVDGVTVEIGVVIAASAPHRGSLKS